MFFSGERELNEGGHYALGWSKNVSLRGGWVRKVVNQ